MRLDELKIEVGGFVSTVLGDDDSLSRTEEAVKLYYAVRDQFQYNPYDIRLNESELHPEKLLQKGRGHCIDKALFLAVCLRSIGIPAKLGMAKVRNHLGTGKFEEMLGTDVLVPHGYTDVFLNDKWVKCTPAFNKELCDRLGVHPLDWDGESDSLFQEDNREGGRFMEYLEDYGSFDELPVDFIRELMMKEYPKCFNEDEEWVGW